jgi:hypothetical protein
MTEVIQDGVNRGKKLSADGYEQVLQGLRQRQEVCVDERTEGALEQIDQQRELVAAVIDTTTKTVAYDSALMISCVPPGNLNEKAKPFSSHLLSRLLCEQDGLTEKSFATALIPFKPSGPADPHRDSNDVKTAKGQTAIVHYASGQDRGIRCPEKVSSLEKREATRFKRSKRWEWSTSTCIGRPCY